MAKKSTARPRFSNDKRFFIKPNPFLEVIVHPVFLVAELEESNGKDDNKEEPGNCRCVAHPEKLEGIAVNMIDNCICGICRSALGHDHGQIKDLE